MKKSILFLCSLFLFCGAAGCGNPQSVTPTNPVICLNGFENQKEFDTMRMNGYTLGSIKLNNDLRYVKTGQGSAKVTVFANPYLMGDSYFFQAADLITRGDDYTDFSETKALTVDVFNDQTMEKKIGLQLVYPSGTGGTEWFTLAPKTWTKVKFTVDRSIIPQVYADDRDTGGSKLKSKVEGVNVLFNRMKEDEVFYFDNFNLYKTKQPFTVSSYSHKADEFSSFDNLWEIKELTASCYGDATLAPILTASQEYTTTGSGASMKVTSVPASSTTRRWPDVTWSSDVFSHLNLESYDENDKIIIEVYCPVEDGIDAVTFELWYWGHKLFSEKTVLTVGEWTTISYTVGELNVAVAEIMESTLYGFASTTSFKLTYEASMGNAKNLYVDNFRMERVSNDTE